MNRVVRASKELSPIINAVANVEKTVEEITSTNTSMEYIRNYYDVPVEKGGRIHFSYSNRDGTIVGARNAHIVVLFDDSEETVCLHPTWNVIYKNDT